MKKKIKDLDTDKIALITIKIVLFIIFAFALICVFLSIYAFAKYGNLPITEIPAWALWFMFGGGRGR